MKSKLNTILLMIFGVCTGILLALLLVYFVLTSTRDREQQPAGNLPAAAQPDTSLMTDPAAAPAEDSSVADESSMIYKQLTPLISEAPSEPGVESIVDPSESRAEASAETTETKLFYLFDNTPIYIQPEGADKPIVDYPDVYSQGLYTGRDYPLDSSFKAIDYRDRTALVPSGSLMEMSQAKIMPVGMISQITENYVGYSGCGPACLHMMEKYSGIRPKVAGISTYDQLLDHAELYGYADQGSLYDLGGGMTSDALRRFAHDVYGAELVNGYDTSRKPTDILKDLIDSGKQAIVLINQENGQMVDSSDKSHFVLFTGYVEDEGKLQFIYANSYAEANITFGYPLSMVDAELVNISAGGKFDEPNAILYLK